MQLIPLKTALYLNSSRNLPEHLQSMPGVKWLYAKDPSEFRELLAKTRGDVVVVVRADFLRLKSVETLAEWGQKYPQLSFIFVIKAIEKAAYQISLNQPHWVFVYESEGVRVKDVVYRRLQGLPVKSRRQERVPVQAPVMIKKSMLADGSPIDGKVQVLKEGEMKDFSQGGAKVSLESSGIKVKDFVSLMYKNASGKWVSIESQVRWVVATASGQQILGVQFLALKA